MIVAIDKMFTEIQNVRQIKGEPRRRWFSDEGLELIVWLGRGKSIIGFQFCYEINQKPKALTWQQHDGFLHSGIDDGASRPGIKLLVGLNFKNH